MPGICGIINGSEPINKMYETLLVSDFVKLKDEYQDDEAKFSHVILNRNDYKNYNTEDVLIYVDGTIYNLEEMNLAFNYHAKFLSELIYIAYKNKKLKEVLNKIDGYYTAFIYDKVEKKVSIFSDRFGMKFLYWYFKDGVFAFASEVKCFLEMKSITCTLNENHIKNYINKKISYLIQDETFFNEIKLLEPSTILEFDINNNELNKCLYWSYSEIEQQSLTYEEAVDSLHDVLLTETKKKLKNIHPANIGLSLSGGLDSRLCLCLALEAGVTPAYIWTMGQKKSSDVEIAREICKKNNLEFHHMEMNEDNFFDPRVKAIWQTDGQMNFVDTHGCEFNAFLAKNFSYIISGYAGDAVLGESFKGNPSFFNKRMNKIIAKDFYGDFLSEQFSDIDNPYYDTPHFEPHIYNNRVRRYTNNGFVLCSPYFEYITPLFSNKVIEFIFSIPDEYREHNNLYSDMLLKYYPDFYKRIAWNRNNLPIKGKIYKNNKNNINGVIEKINNSKILSKKWKNSIIKRVIKFYKYERYKRGFFNYSKVMSEKSFTDKLKTYFNPQMLCKKFMDKDLYEKVIHNTSELDFYTLYNILTMEIYLRQVKQLQK